ncbi:MAG: Rid family detoxifying hydrolase [Deltaproteobacteria bacterium]
MKKTIIASDKLPVVGPYSAAVEAGGFIFISGQIALDPKTGEAITDIQSATSQVLTNIQTILDAAGLKLTNIVKTTIYLKNITDFAAVNEVYTGFFPEDQPARSTIEVSSLPKGVPIEIEAIAARN